MRAAIAAADEKNDLGAYKTFKEAHKEHVAFMKAAPNDPGLARVVRRAVRMRHRLGVRRPSSPRGRERRARTTCAASSPRRLTGKPCETFSGTHMQRGQAQEPDGRMRYEVATGNIVEEVGFIKHAELAAGCSPDGLIDDDGGSRSSA
jgi:hypothetical protein